MAEEETNEGLTKEEEQTLRETLRSNYPWLVDMGLENFVVDKIRDDSTMEEVLAAVRQTPQYKARFPAMTRDDGSRRFGTEAEYVQAEDDFRQVLVDYGAYDPAQDGPATFAQFFESGVDARELGQRFQVYRALERGSQDIRDAFYIYSGLDVSVDDLYEAVTSHKRQEQLVQSYDNAVAGQNLDFETFANRVTEKGLERIVQVTEELGKIGIMPTGDRQKLLNMNPEQARELVGALFTTSYESDSPTMNLDELLNSFEYAMIGSAASASGFEMPDAARIQEFIDAGVDRARALRGYSQAALREAGLGAIADRFNQGDINQGVLEDAFVLGEAKAANDVTRLFKQESSLGQAGAGFSRNVEGGRIVQQGRARR